MKGTQGTKTTHRPEKTFEVMFPPNWTASDVCAWQGRSESNWLQFTGSGLAGAAKNAWQRQGTVHTGREFPLDLAWTMEVAL